MNSAARVHAEQPRVRDIEGRLLATLRISGRRLVEMRPGAWAVLGRPDRRTRRLLTVDGETVARLLAERKLSKTQDGACVRAEGVVIAPPPSLSACAFIAAGRPRRNGESAKGFLGLAVLARRGLGPLNMRQVKAGLQLMADAEQESNSKGLTVNWDAGPAGKRRRGPVKGGQSAAVASAMARLKRVRGLAGEAAWTLAWLTCVDGASMVSIKAQTGLSRRNVGTAIARALENIANAYER